METVSKKHKTCGFVQHTASLRSKMPVVQNRSFVLWFLGSINQKHMKQPKGKTDSQNTAP